MYQPTQSDGFFLKVGTPTLYHEKSKLIEVKPWIIYDATIYQNHQVYQNLNFGYSYQN